MSGFHMDTILRGLCCYPSCALPVILPVHSLIFQFCGSTIAGLSLLSDSIMRLVKEGAADEWLDLLLPRHSLYILRLYIYCTKIFLPHNAVLPVALLQDVKGSEPTHTYEYTYRLLISKSGHKEKNSELPFLFLVSYYDAKIVSVQYL